MNKKIEVAFVNLLEENQNILHKICRLYTFDEETHKDMFQEMVIQLWKSYPTFKGNSKFSTWAYRVALNTAISLFRTKKRNVETVDWDVAVNYISYPEYDNREDEQLNRIYATVRQLNDIEKALVYLYLEDKSYVEIAETLGISEGNARVRMNRVKTKIKNRLNGGR
ncbi:sigma-70 family RNA polymerase sigma factor [Sphingobacterium sp. UT-1RO-CII-1]|uniref:RNA polymerase sigma factor n=1 Tax=Sphingobacterium sp. UT-1RO-CII-1 TaxID=2995225 RepID=UPI00227BD93B|nr:sigma-70 family RNA polymerase sigma factor [Sphingobacterium sp. UT-1RO-CII-1]MCY4778617.1 sigma-70 family RNA polymerase sigma factor [Sphingobacterium sp. UT-1RO-CII-1]